MFMIFKLSHTAIQKRKPSERTASFFMRYARRAVRFFTGGRRESRGRCSSSARGVCGSGDVCGTMQASSPTGHGRHAAAALRPEIGPGGLENKARPRGTVKTVPYEPRRKLYGTGTGAKRPPCQRGLDAPLGADWGIAFGLYAVYKQHFKAKQSLRHGLRPCHLPLTREAMGG